MDPGAGKARQPETTDAVATAAETQRSQRFSALLGGTLIVLGLVALWRHHPLRAGACLAAAVLAPAAAYLASPLWVRVFRAWMKFAELLGWLTTRVVLTVFFYALLTPYGLVSRLLRQDPLDLNWRRRRPSYWIDKPSSPPARERYERQY